MAFQPIRPANETMIGMDERIESKILGRADRPNAVGKSRTAHGDNALGGKGHDVQAVGARRAILDVDITVAGHEIVGRRRRPEHHVQLGMSRDELRQARQQPLGGEARCRVHRKPVALAAAGEVHRRRLNAAERGRDLPVIALAAIGRDYGTPYPTEKLNAELTLQ